MLGLDFRLTNRVLRRGEAPYSPASLPGLIAWYDPKDLGSLFQDAAMTQPVVADGDPVGAMQDKSGNGHHVTQSSASARPIYHTDGSRHWLSFDGVNDKLVVPAPVTPAGSSIYAAAAFSFPVSLPSSNGAVLSDANYLSGGVMLGWIGSTLMALGNSTVQAEDERFPMPAIGDVNVMSTFTGVGSYAYSSSFGTKPHGSDNVFSLPGKPLTIGAGTQGGISNHFGGNFYGAVYAEAQLTDATALDQWMLEQV